MPSEGASVAQSPARNELSNAEKLHTVAAVIVGPLLDAMTIRDGTESVVMTMNQRPARRSNRMRPPNVAAAPLTLSKKLVVSALSTPSGMPDFRKLRTRPLAIAMNCVVPAAALPSGGNVDNWEN